MEFLLDPTIWVGLLTLVVLEIVLGIDNLVFIAIIAKKLPASQQDKALYVGLGLALITSGPSLHLSWLVASRTRLLRLGHPFSFRDLILLGGGLFLLFKATTELHERLEALPHSEKHGSGRAGFWVVIAQILLLDAVFSLDSIITAVGMVDNLYVMMSAVVIAMIVMIAASRPLTDFVNRHPTVVVLCLSH
ncbi:MAG: TerC family protein [Sutterella wadsworthensis]